MNFENSFVVLYQHNSRSTVIMYILVFPFRLSSIKITYPGKYDVTMDVYDITTKNLWIL